MIEVTDKSASKTHPSGDKRFKLLEVAMKRHAYRSDALIAQHYIHDGQASEGILNRLEAGIRAFDPCLICSTHAIGQMPLVVTLMDAAGRSVREWKREPA